MCSQEHYAHLTPQYDPQIEQILRQNERGGYDLVTFEPTVEKAETHYSLQNSGLAADDEWRGRRGVLGTNGSPTRELPDEILRAFKDWCASPEMQVMHASFTSLLAPN